MTLPLIRVVAPLDRAGVVPMLGYMAGPEELGIEWKANVFAV